jgi:hypothetical protein
MTVADRRQAYLWLRLTEKLELAATALADASNSGTNNMARLTAVYVALIGIVAIAAIVGAAASIYVMELGPVDAGACELDVLACPPTPTARVRDLTLSNGHV